MTCIIGVVCEDGIVLVGDKKIKAGNIVRYEDKIIPVGSYKNFVVAAAGFLDIREKFIQDLKNLSLLQKNGIIKEDPSRGFIGKTEDIAYRLYEIYGPRYKAKGYEYAYEAFEAFVCYKPEKIRPILYYIDSVGTSSKVGEYQVLGTGKQYAHLFIKPIMMKEANMKGMALIATFVIRLIDEHKIDDSIGPDDQGMVQIWKFPNEAEPYEVKGSELEEILKEVEVRLEKFRLFLILGRTTL